MFSFFHRIELPGGPPINIDDHEVLLSAEADQQKVVLTSRNRDLQLRKAERIYLEGHGFETESAAREAGIQWRSILERVFASVAAAADFGDRAPRGGFTRAGIDAIEQSTGKRLLNDSHQLIVYESEPPPVFGWAGPVALRRSATREMFERALASEGSRVPTGPAESLAFDLFSASFGVQSIVDARFMLLMMALETLIDQVKRGDTTRKFVDELIANTSDAELSTDGDRQSIRSSLGYLKRESISQAGRRLVRGLGDRRYNDMLATKFFDECYEVRSALVHGSVPRRERNKVDRLAANLEILVGDLIAGTQLLDDTNFRATS